MARQINRRTRRGRARVSPSLTGGDRRLGRVLESSTRRVDVGSGLEIDNRTASTVVSLGNGLALDPTGRVSLKLSPGSVSPLVDKSGGKSGDLVVPEITIPTVSTLATLQVLAEETADDIATLAAAHNKLVAVLKKKGVLD